MRRRARAAYLLKLALESDRKQGRVAHDAQTWRRHQQRERAAQRDYLEGASRAAQLDRLRAAAERGNKQAAAVIPDAVRLARDARD